MARYKKIDMRMWHGDEKFGHLRGPTPNPQTLWVYLLTGPHNTILPGLFVAGEAGLAEALDWPLDDFRAAWQEIEAAGMAKADWKTRLVWLINAIKHNPPENQNVIVGWAKAWEEMPECPLKGEALGAFRTHLEGIGGSLWRTFREAFGESLESPQGAQKPAPKDPKNQPFPEPSPSPPGALPEPSGSPPRALSEGQGEPSGSPEPALSNTVAVAVAVAVAETTTETSNFKDRGVSLAANGNGHSELSPQGLMDLWNEKAPAKLARVKLLTKGRREKARLRLSAYPLAKFWRDVVGRLDTPFLTGENGKGWKADFDWLVSNDTVAAKILEGKYVDGPKRRIVGYDAERYGPDKYGDRDL